MGRLYGRVGLVAASVAAGLRWGGPRHGATFEITDGGVEPDARLVEVVKLPAGCAASLDAISTVALRVVAGMAFAFGVDALPDGLLVRELEHLGLPGR